MRWVRAYTENLDYSVKSGRSIVIDPEHCEPFFNSDYDYRGLFETMTEDTVLIEWDIAISREDRARFEEHIASSPGRVHVAPYKHYFYKPEGQEYGWVHRNGEDSFSVAEGEPECQFFGFGLVYLPLWLVRAFLDELSNGQRMTERAQRRGLWLAVLLQGQKVTDVSFSAWHWQATGHTVPIHWDVRPIHLNYKRG